MCNNLTEKPEIFQDIKNGKTLDWRGKKIRNLYYSEVLRLVQRYKKSKRVKECAEVLRFKENAVSGERKLYQAWFCKSQLCPICSWRKSIKLGFQNRTIVANINKDYPRMNWLFLTLTIKNVEADELRDSLSQLTKAFDRLFKYKDVDKVVKGYFRATEVTYDGDEFITKKKFQKQRKYYLDRGLEIGDKNPNYRKFHPHLHILICVPSSYFSKTYISQSKWIELWAKALKVDYSPVVHIQRVKAKKKGMDELSAIFEVSKYPVKDTDVMSGNRDEDSYAVLALENALKGKRMISYGKLMKEYHKKLNLENIETADLIKVADEENDEIAEKVFDVIAIWNNQHQNYFIHREIE